MRTGPGVGDAPVPREESVGSKQPTPMNQQQQQQGAMGASCFGEAALLSRLEVPQYGGNSVVNCKGNIIHSPKGGATLSLFHPAK